MTHKVYPTITTDVIQKFHQEMPEVKVYAGIDQYRGSMRQELYRIHRKLQAGAVGFFTQPFLICVFWKCMLICWRDRMFTGVLRQ